MLTREIPVYVNKTYLSEKLGVSVPTIDRLLYHEVITEDAVIWSRGRRHPLFLQARIKELEQAVKNFHEEIEEARNAS